MKRLVLAMAISAALSSPLSAQQPTVYSVPLSDQEIEAIIQTGNICLKALGYDCAVAIDIRAKLLMAKQPKPAAAPAPTPSALPSRQ